MHLEALMKFSINQLHNYLALKTLGFHISHLFNNVFLNLVIVFIYVIVSLYRATVVCIQVVIKMKEQRRCIKFI